MGDCHFCDIQLHRERLLPEDEVLAESRRFYIKPALGHFCDGYCLINAKRHVTSFSFLDGESLHELTLVLTATVARLQSIYGRMSIAFEHGEVGGRFHPGCCFEHAHLHVIPLPPEVSDRVAFDFRVESLGRLEELVKYSETRTPYLLYFDRHGQARVYLVDRNLPSQFLRREICQRLETPDVWDWGVFPFRERIEKFSRLYHAAAVQEGWEMSIV